MQPYTVYARSPITGEIEKLMTGKFPDANAALEGLSEEIVKGFRKVGLVPTGGKPEAYKLVNEADGAEKWYNIKIAVEINVLGRELDAEPEKAETLVDRLKKAEKSGERRPSKSPPSLADMLNEGKDLPEEVPDYSETFSAQDMGEDSEGETAFQEELDEEEEDNPAREPAEREENAEIDKEENR